jgi:hypothetical protein
MEKFEIGGKTFQFADGGTARHDVFTMRQIAACGVNIVGQREDETDEQFQYRLYRTALQSGDVFLLIGSLLLPEGTKPEGWTEAMARETADFLGNLTHPPDKAKLRLLLASALIPFFVSGQRSLRTSPRSSTRPGSDLAPTESADTPSTATGA